MEIHHNVFDQQEMQYIQDEYNGILAAGQFIVNKFVWQPDLVAGHNGSVYMQHASPEVKKLVMHKFKNWVDIDDSVCVRHYIWDYQSGINWHRDDCYRWAATIYLNEYWPIEWGGHFYYQERGETKMVVPEYNSAVINKEKIDHKVNPVRHQGFPLRHTLQVFNPE